MNGCIYRTKDNECELWSVDKRHSFCDIETCNDKVVSNADRIRSMTDEELANEFLDAQCESCDWQGDCPDMQPCIDRITEWLKAEVQDV